MTLTLDVDYEHPQNINNSSHLNSAISNSSSSNNNKNKKNSPKQSSKEAKIKTKVSGTLQINELVVFKNFRDKVSRYQFNIM